MPLVPAGVKGTDGLRTPARRGAVNYGAPIDVDDLRGLPAADAARIATDRVMAAIAELEARAL